jgi:hypothetical protein
MLGRVVFVLCLLVGIANACPPKFDTPEEEAAFNEAFLRWIDEHERAAKLGAIATNDVSEGMLVAFALMGVCALGFVITRGNAVRRTFATSHHLAPVELEVIARVAHVQCRRAAWFAGCSALALGVLPSLPLVPEAQVALGALPLFLLAGSILAISRMAVLTSLRPEPDLRVFSHGHFMLAARGNRLLGWASAPPRLLARVTSLPTAKIH